MGIYTHSIILSHSLTSPHSSRLHQCTYTQKKDPLICKHLSQIYRYIQKYLYHYIYLHTYTESHTALPSHSRISSPIRPTSLSRIYKISTYRIPHLHKLIHNKLLSIHHVSFHLSIQS